MLFPSKCHQYRRARAADDDDPDNSQLRSPTPPADAGKLLARQREQHPLPGEEARRPDDGSGRDQRALRVSCAPCAAAGTALRPCFADAR
jgi:hypothetical protein